MSKKHTDIFLWGKVQGVGLRYSTKEKADQLGLMGYVRNLRDGSVSIEVEGDNDIMEIFLKWIELGPGYSIIERIEKRDGEIRGFREFSLF